MSEQQGDYIVEALDMLGKGYDPAEEKHMIRDESPHDYFGSIPHLVDEMKLSPYAYRLYGRFKRVAGETGKCWQSTKTLAEACQMSAGKISEAKYELEHVYPPLVRIVPIKKDNFTYHEVYVTDIWTMNHEHFTGHTVHIVNGEEARSQYERSRSHGETKKNPSIKKNTEIHEEEAAAALKAISRTFETEIGVITPMIADGLKDAADTYPLQWVLDAIRESSAQNKRSWKYAAAILKRWGEQGNQEPMKKATPAPGQGKPSNRDQNMVHLQNWLKQGDPDVR